MLLTDSTLLGPALRPPAEHDPLRQLALLADDAADPLELGTDRLVGDDDLVQAIGDLARHARPLKRHAGREITGFDLGQELQ